MPENNTFVDQRHAIMFAAAELYRADKGDVVSAQEVGRVTLMTPVVGENPGALRDAEYQQARLDTAARAIARLASLADRRDQGGVRGMVAALETGLTKVIERPYLGDLGAVATLVEGVRRSDDTLPTVEQQQ